MSGKHIIGHVIVSAYTYETKLTQKEKIRKTTAILEKLTISQKGMCLLKNCIEGEGRKMP